jgi:hypothetical protein
MLFNFIQISIDIKVSLATVGYNLYCVSDFIIIAIELKKVQMMSSFTFLIFVVESIFSLHRKEFSIDTKFVI